MDANPNEKVSANEAAAVLLSNSQREFLQGLVYHHGGRWAESVKRKNNRGVFENFVSDPNKKIILNNDNDENRRLFENCEIKGKRICNPIVDWLDRDVWEYIRSERLEINPLYEMGFYRVGCLGCPMAGKNRWTEFRLFPTYLSAGIYPSIWEDAGCDSCWRREDEVEDGGGCVLVVDGRGDGRGTD